MNYRMKTSDRAIDFTVKTVGGGYINLHDFKGEKILLSFYRYAACPFCNLRIQEFLKKYAYYKANGLYVIAVFQSPESSMLQYVGKQEVPFALIPDPNRDLYEMYRVEKSIEGLIRGMLQINRFAKALRKGFYPGRVENGIDSLPADFLIDSNFTIKKAHYGKDIADHLSFEEIEAFIFDQ